MYVVEGKGYKVDVFTAKASQAQTGSTALTADKSCQVYRCSVQLLHTSPSWLLTTLLRFVFRHSRLDSFSVKERITGRGGAMRRRVQDVVRKCFTPTEQIKITSLWRLQSSHSGFMETGGRLEWREEFLMWNILQKEDLRLLQLTYVQV